MATSPITPRKSALKPRAGGETGSVVKTKLGAGPKIAAARTVPASTGSQSTLKASDLEPGWQGPLPVRTETVPLPRKAPHRKA